MGSYWDEYAVRACAQCGTLVVLDPEQVAMLDETASRHSVGRECSMICLGCAVRWWTRHDSALSDHLMVGGTR